MKELRLKESEEEGEAVFKIASQPRADAKYMQDPALLVAPVYAEAESSAPPTQVFTFRDPALGPSQRGRGRSPFGMLARQGRGPPRKSPPPREVGPGGSTPEGLNEENSEGLHPELEEASSVDENEEPPQPFLQDEEEES